MREKIAILLASSLLLPPELAEAKVEPNPWGSSVRIEEHRRSFGAKVPSKLRRSQKAEPVRATVPFCKFSRVTDFDVGCASVFNQPAAAEQLTPGRVARAVREIPMPRLRARVQPGGRTLVNVPTILHTQPRTVRRSVDLLGHEIEVVARASRFRWHHGDGTTQQTTTPGKPYPSKLVVHRYRRTADAVVVRVDTTYTVRYRVGDGDWTDLGVPLTATGPGVRVRVDEAAPVLVDP